MKKLHLFVTVFLISMAYVAQSQAVIMYIGDRDGFGYGKADGYVGADGEASERTGDRSMLDMGDHLPDRDRDYLVHYLSGDNFDYRSAEEKNDVTNSGTKWTDISLSKSYLKVAPGLAGEAVFVFRFTPPQPGDPDYGRDHYISLMYADYDLSPMVVEVDGKQVNLEDNVENAPDGYIWRAFLQVSWSDMLDGTIVVKVLTDDPYVAFDYVLLDVTPLAIVKPNTASFQILLLGD